MSTGDEGAYYAAQRQAEHQAQRQAEHRVERRKKIAVAAFGLVAILGGGAYAATTWFAAQNATTSGDIGALAPIVPAPSASASASRSPSASPSASSASQTPTRLSGARQSSRPSPTPVPTGLPDDQVVSSQVNHLLRAPHETSSADAAADSLTPPDDAITVANEKGADGSAIRVLSARYDLTADGTLLWAADNGHRINGAACTQNIRAEGETTARIRPNVMLCWRTSADKSVVTVATSENGRPSAALSSALIARTWFRMD